MWPGIRIRNCSPVPSNLGVPALFSATSAWFGGASAESSLLVGPVFIPGVKGDRPMPWVSCGLPVERWALGQRQQTSGNGGVLAATWAELSAGWGEGGGKGIHLRKQQSGTRSEFDAGAGPPSNHQI